MADRDIVAVVWDERHHRIDVIYAEGEAERVWGSEAVAVVLAKNAGLCAVSASEGTRRWVRDPDMP